MGRDIVQVKADTAASDNLAKARTFQGLHEYAAATVHARMAFELILKSICEKRGIKVRFRSDPRKLSTEDLLTAFEGWLVEPIKTSVAPAIASNKMFRQLELNPFSHSTPVSLAASEVLGAIDAVENLKQAINDHIK